MALLLLIWTSICLLDINFNYVQLTLVGGICSCLKSYNLNYLAKKSSSHVVLCFRFLTPNTATKIPFMYLEKGIAWPKSQFIQWYIHESVSALYILRISPHIFLQPNRQTGDTWMWELGLSLRQCNSFPGNICFKFSVSCLCSEL